MKVLSADGSVGFPHVRVGHCQALYLEEPRTRLSTGFFYGSLKGGALTALRGGFSGSRDYIEANAYTVRVTLIDFDAVF